MDRIRWGIIGCGNIAGDFAKGLETLEGAELLAAASRTTGKAEAFAREYLVRYSYDSYEELLANDEVDVVYVATTHNFHYGNVLQCLDAGKHVLCEKVFTINADQARHLQKVARGKRLFLMEAMWTRFLPATREILGVIDSGVIGEVMFLEAEFSLKFDYDPAGRLFNMDLAGGGLLDLGIYPVSYASMFFGQQPQKIEANGCFAETGADIRCTQLFDYGSGKAAMLTCSSLFYRKTDARIAGTKGYIEVDEFFMSTRYTVHVGGESVVHEVPFESSGKGYEAAEVMACIREGRIESDIWQLDQTVANMETMDRIRAKIGLRYSDEMEKQL